MTDPTNDGTTPPPPPPAGSTPGGYSQPSGYSQPGAYGQPDASAQQPAAYSAPGAYAQPGYGTPGPKKTLSLIGMIGGIAGLALSLFGGWGILFSIAGVVLGHLGQKREGLPAKGFWLTALITGYIGILVALIWFAFYIIITIITFGAIGSAGTNYDF